MSLTAAEQGGWRLELSRLARQGWADDKRRRVQAIQDGYWLDASNARWDQAEREQQNPAPEPTSIGEAAKLVHAQHPTWTFQESWDYAEAVYPKLGKGTIQVMCQHALQTCGPSVIQYMPAGRTTLTPSVNGARKTDHRERDPAHGVQAAG